MTFNQFGMYFSECLQCNAMNEPQEGKLLIIDRYFPMD